jgi:amino acid permease
MSLGFVWCWVLIKQSRLNLVSKDTKLNHGQYNRPWSWWGIYLGLQMYFTCTTIEYFYRCAHSLDIELEHKINSYLQASMYYFVYYINISLKSRKENRGNRWLTKSRYQHMWTLIVSDVLHDTIFHGNSNNTL